MFVAVVVDEGRTAALLAAVPGLLVVAVLAVGVGLPLVLALVPGLVL